MPSPTQQWGFGLESEAAQFLQRRGYRIVARNVRSGGGEIDVVAWDGRILCFVEVRARRSDRFGDPALTVSMPKQRRIVRAAMAYLSRARGSWPMVRFDVVSIVAPSDGPRRFTLIQNAFDAGF